MINKLIDFYNYEIFTDINNNKCLKIYFNYLGETDLII